jgi:hypothetical protein
MKIRLIDANRERLNQLREDVKDLSIVEVEEVDLLRKGGSLISDRVKRRF